MQTKRFLPILSLLSSLTAAAPTSSSVASAAGEPTSTSTADGAEFSAWEHTSFDVLEYTDCDTDQQAILAREWNFALDVANSHLKWEVGSTNAKYNQAQTMFLGDQALGRGIDYAWNDRIYISMKNAQQLHYGKGRYKPKGLQSSRIIVYCDAESKKRPGCTSDANSFVPAYTENNLGLFWNQFEINICAGFWNLESGASVEQKIKNKEIDVRNISPWEYSQAFVYHLQTYSLDWLVSYQNQHNRRITAETCYEYAQQAGTSACVANAMSYVLPAFAMYALDQLDAPVVPMPQEVFTKSITDPTGTLVTLPSQTITYPDIAILTVAAIGNESPDPDVSGAPNSATWTQLQLKGVMASAAPVPSVTETPTKDSGGITTTKASGGTTTTKPSGGATTTYTSTTTPQCTLGSAPIPVVVPGQEPGVGVQSPYCTCGKAAADCYWPPTSDPHCDNPCAFISCSKKVVTTTVAL